MSRGLGDVYKRQKEELDLMENPDDYQVKLKCVEVFKGLKSKIKKIF